MLTTRTMRGWTGAAAMLVGACLMAQDAMAASLAGAEYGGTARYPYLCSHAGAWPPDNCCSAFDGVCDEDVVENVPTDRRNILLVVADDHDYCLFGFMAGLCSNDPDKDCHAETDCGTEGRCVSSRDFGACSATTATVCYDDEDCPSEETCNHASPSGLRLRLNDLTCRNRQPKRPRKNDFEWCDASDEYEQKLDRKQLWFSREGAPCRAGTNGPTPPDAYPVAFTPHLDALAGSGAVFPRAYVAGTICKNSRRAMVHGRHLRHLQWLWQNDGTDKEECRRAEVVDARLGCRKLGETSNCGVTDGCEPAHTIAWWLESDRAISPVEPDDLNLPDGDGYRSFAFAKIEVMKPGRGGFAPKGSSGEAGSKTGRGPGKIVCEGDSGCEQVLTMTTTQLTTGTSLPPYPTEAVFDFLGRSHYELTEAIDTTMEMESTTGGNAPVQTQPLLVWWGPHIPHAGPKAEHFLRDLYDKDGTPGDDKSNVHKNTWEHYARVSWLDASFGGIVYHLRRSCACKSDLSGAQSLWDNTVVLFLSDHGWLLPGSKGNTRENTQRTPLLINDPSMRDDPALVFEHEMASAVDLMPTIMAYAGDVRYFPSGSGDNPDEYPLGRNLKQWVDNPTTPGSWDRRRNLTFGEDLNTQGSGNTNPGGPSPRHIVTRPGLFGTCNYPYNFTAAADPERGNDPSDDCGDDDVCHVHPCLTDADCKDFGPEGEDDLGFTYVFTPLYCATEGHANLPAWKRCVNRPWQRCASDGDCRPIGNDPNWCIGSPDKTCQPGDDRRGFYNDFTGRSCATAADCVPPGVCQPLLLKAQWGTSGDAPEAIWDLDWDPDQTTNLLGYQDGTPYRYIENDQMDPLKEKLSACMTHFLQQDTSENYDWINKVQSGAVICDSALRNWNLN